jgi:hypothetical protein
MGELMEQEMVQKTVTVVIVLLLIVWFYARVFGNETIIVDVEKNLTPEVTVSLIEKNVKVSVSPLADGTYFYRITSEPELEVNVLTDDLDEEGKVDVITIFSFKDRDVRGISVGPNGRDDRFTAEDGPNTPKLEAEVTTIAPPIQDWRGRPVPLEHGIPVIIRSNTGSPIIATAFANKIYSITPSFDSTPLYDCEAKVEFYCEDDIKYTNFLKGCETDDENCEESVNVCGGNVYTRISENPDCTKRIIPAEIEYKEGKSWDVGEIVGISFWKYSECTKKRTDFRELLVFCAKDRIGGKFEMNAGLLFEPGGGGFGGSGASGTF